MQKVLMKLKTNIHLFSIDCAIEREISFRFGSEFHKKFCWNNQILAKLELFLTICGKLFIILIRFGWFNGGRLKVNWWITNQFGWFAMSWWIWRIFCVWRLLAARWPQRWRWWCCRCYFWHCFLENTKFLSEITYQIISLTHSLCVSVSLNQFNLFFRMLIWGSVSFVVSITCHLWKMVWLIRGFFSALCESVQAMFN